MNKIRALQIADSIFNDWLERTSESDKKEVEEAMEYIENNLK